jgi:hypothetical protein
MPATVSLPPPEVKGRVPCRAYYNKKLAEGKTPKEALRALKHQVSHAIYTVLQAGARKATAQPGEPGRATEGGSHPSAADSVDDHVIPRAGAHLIPQVLAYTCFT